MSETAQFVDAAVSLAPQIRALAGEIDQFRRLPPSLVDAITRAGLFRLLLPRSLGGPETDPMTFVRVVEEVSRADGATGWCVALIGEYGVFSGYLPPETAGEIYGGNPNVRTAGQLRAAGQARVVEGGYRVTGRWPLGSGCQHANWIVGGCRILDGDEPRLRADGTPISRLFFFGQLTAKSSTLGTASACVGLAATTILLLIFLSPRLGHCPFGNRRWKQARSMRFRQSPCSAPHWRRSRSGLRVMP
jgi:hypothetical protein